MLEHTGKTELYNYDTCVNEEFLFIFPKLG